MSLYILTTIHKGWQSSSRIFFHNAHNNWLCICHNIASSKQPIRFETSNCLNLTCGYCTTMSEYRSPPMGAFVLSSPSKTKIQSVTGKSSAVESRTLQNLNGSNSVSDQVEKNETEMKMKNVFIGENRDKSRLAENKELSVHHCLDTGLVKEEIRTDYSDNQNVMMKIRLTGPPKFKQPILPVQLMQLVSNTVKDEYNSSCHRKLSESSNENKTVSPIGLSESSNENKTVSPIGLSESSNENKTVSPIGLSENSNENKTVSSIGLSENSIENKTESTCTVSLSESSCKDENSSVCGLPIDRNKYIYERDFGCLDECNKNETGSVIGLSNDIDKNVTETGSAIHLSDSEKNDVYYENHFGKRIPASKECDLEKISAGQRCNSNNLSAEIMKKDNYSNDVFCQDASTNSTRREEQAYEEVAVELYSKNINNEKGTEKVNNSSHHISDANFNEQGEIATNEISVNVLSSDLNERSAVDLNLDNVVLQEENNHTWSFFPYADVDLSENEETGINEEANSVKRKAKKRKKKKKARARKMRKTENEGNNICLLTDRCNKFQDLNCQKTENTNENQSTDNLSENDAKQEVEENLGQEIDESRIFPFSEVDILAYNKGGLQFDDMDNNDVSKIDVKLDNDMGEKTDQSKKRKRKRKFLASKRKRTESIKTESDDDEADKKSGKKKVPAKPRPNYFISVQITNSEIHSAVEAVKNTVLSKNKDLQSAMVPTPTIHLTLMVMYLENEDDIDRAKTALDNCADKLKYTYDSKILVMDICGIGHFRDEIVFAKVSPGEPLDDLTQIAEEVEACFEENGVPSTDKKSFKPHITMMKLSKTHGKLKKKGIKKIDGSLYKEHVNRSFGKQLFTGLQLCSMLKRKDPSGYYHIEHQVKIGPQKSNFSTLTSVQGHSLEEVSAVIVCACVQSAVEKFYTDMPKQTVEIKNCHGNKTKKKSTSNTKHPVNNKVVQEINVEMGSEDDMIPKGLEPIIDISREIVKKCIESAIKILQKENKIQE